MKKVILLYILLVSVIIIIFGFVLSKTGFVVSEENINQEYLKNLKLNVNVECLQNSQCPENSECVGNECININEINLCHKVGLFTQTKKLSEGNSINSVKGVLTDNQLPYLLADGEIVEIIDDKPIEHFYIQTILIGDSKIEKDNKNYFVKINNEPIYTYRLIFSKSVDFSSRNIQKQVLRILGKEYIIGISSTNSIIKLISNDKTIKLEDGKNVDILKDNNGNIIKFDVEFNIPNTEKRVKSGENYIDPIFDSIKLSFNYVSSKEFADVRIGGKC